MGGGSCCVIGDTPEETLKAQLRWACDWASGMLDTLRACYWLMESQSAILGQGCRPPDVMSKRDLAAKQAAASAAMSGMVAQLNSRYELGTWPCAKGDRPLHECLADDLEKAAAMAKSGRIPTFSNPDPEKEGAK